MFNIRDERVFKLEAMTGAIGLRVSWTLGNFCVYKCSYCPSYLNDGSKPYHSADIVLDVFNKLPPNTGVTFLGGEPTYHPEFERIVLEKPDHIKIMMVSNGAKPLSFWETVTPKIVFLTFTFHPEFANIDRFIRNSLEASKHVKRFQVFLVMIPEKWDYCIKVYNKLIEQGFDVHPKPILKDFGAEILPGYSKEHLGWIHYANKGGEFKNIRIVDKSGEAIYTTTPNELLASKQTNFYGFECYTPMESIAIEVNGDVYNSKCDQRSKIGNIYSGSFEIPTEPMLCKQEMCFCQADIVAKKIKI